MADTLHDGSPARETTEISMSHQYVVDAIKGLELVNQYGHATIAPATLADLEAQRLVLRDQIKFRE